MAVGVDVALNSVLVLERELVILHQARRKIGLGSIGLRAKGRDVAREDDAFVQMLRRGDDSFHPLELNGSCCCCA